MLQKQIITGVILAACCLLAFASSALAQSSGGFGGRPANPDPDNPRSESIFIYTLKGGEEKKDQVLVTNNGDDPVTISLYAVDGVVTNTGAYTCKQESEARIGVGEWMEIAEETVRLKPSEKKLVDFTLTMPKDADVGEHNGCIVFENADDEGDAVNGGAVRLRTRSAIRVVSTIPGELYRNIEVAGFSATPLDKGHQAYKLKLQNNGNVSADVNTKVTLTNMLGKVVYENGGGYPVFANQKLDIDYVNEVRPFWGGWFTAKTSISYDKRAGTFGTENTAELTTKEAKEVSFFIMPSPTAMVIILTPVVLIIGGLLWLIIRSIARRRAKKQWGTYRVAAGDSIESIAARHNVNWKKLASINGIKAPYTIKEGATLNVPGAAAAQVAPVTRPIIDTDDIDKLLEVKSATNKREPKKPGHNTTRRK